MQPSWNFCRAFALTVALCGAGMLASAHAAQPFLLLKLDGAYVKWGDPVLGSGAVVRYALVTGRVEFSGTRNCEAMIPLAPALQRSGIGLAALRNETAAAFALWERAADIRFEEAADPAAADILIGAQAAPRGRAFADVAFRGDKGQTRRIERALICLNPAQPWKIGFGGDPAAYDLRYTIAHEIGHAIGLNHPGPSGQLMGFKYAESFRGLQAGDLEGAVALYGGRDGTTAATVAPPRTTQPAEMGLR